MKLHAKKVEVLGLSLLRTLIGELFEECCESCANIRVMPSSPLVLSLTTRFTQITFLIIAYKPREVTRSFGKVAEQCIR